MKLINWRSNPKNKHAPRGFLSRLARDRRGSTVAMMAGALIPMIGFIGSAVDISRAYLVKTRLQQACDAGVLAARRTMTGQSVSSDANAKQQATNFFNTNLRDGAYGATVVPIVVSDVPDANGNATGVVHGTASADVPTTLMKIFGKRKITMIAECEAQLQVSNNDVMFVLDVTGSMNCPAATPSCSNNGGTEATNSKIDNVRDGVVEFYDTLAAATTAGSQLRIGFIPYSSSVNVGKLLPSAYIADSWTYQSRQRIAASYQAAQTTYGAWSTTATGNWSSWSTVSTTNTVQQSACTAPSDSTSYGAVTTTQGTMTTDSDFNRSTPVTDQRTATDSDYQATWVKTTTVKKVDYGTCTVQLRTLQRTEQRTGATTQTPNYTWSYAPIVYDTSSFKLGNGVTTRTGNGYSNVSSTWNGCIEERQTVSNDVFSSIPTDAYDLQIDVLPTSDITKWKPAWPELIYSRSGTAAETSTSDGSTTNTGNTYWHPTNDYAACPKQAAKLAVMTHASVYNYVHASDFKATGGTYHDVGMIWGARFVSPTGIFASENATAPNGKPVNRHIVFMTDGAMAPNPLIYSLYGLEKIDRRISGAANTPTVSDLTARHLSRFSAVCQAAKDKNITIWVVAYDQTMTTELQNCASPGKAYYASNDTQMKQALQNIANQIAQLRLSR